MGTGEKITRRGFIEGCVRATSAIASLAMVGANADSCDGRDLTQPEYGAVDCKVELWLSQRTVGRYMNGDISTQEFLMYLIENYGNECPGLSEADIELSKTRYDQGPWFIVRNYQDR
jgi:hypothetical protein